MEQGDAGGSESVGGTQVWEAVVVGAGVVVVDTGAAVVLAGGPAVVVAAGGVGATVVVGVAGAVPPTGRMEPTLFRATTILLNFTHVAKPAGSWDE